MVSVHSLVQAGDDIEAVAAALDRDLADSGARADFLYVFYGCGHDDATLLAYLHRRFPDAVFLGGTSCTGVMNGRGLHGAGSVGLLLIDDPQGDYGVAAERLGNDPAATAERVLRAALDNAGCPGELPELVWIFQAPGHEEDVVAGLRRVVGDACPIIGGSAADDTVEGRWRQLAPGGVFEDGLVVAVLFPSGGVGYAFQGGYEPAGPSGIVTRIDFSATGGSGIVTRSSGRHVGEIDGRPAAEVYNGWIGNRLDAKVATGGTILAETTMCPIAVDAGEIEGIPHYLLIHPEAMTPTGGLRTFASLEEGTRIYSMCGDRRRLVDRASRVAREAAALLPNGIEGLAGGLMVYCAGCMLAVDADMPMVAHQVADSFAGTPFLGCFTFGEQGQLVGRNVHGNLMISAVAFGA